MRQEKYLEKVLKKVNKELKKRGLVDDFIVTGRVEGKVPVILFESTDRNSNRVYPYNLADEYITYLEEDVSVAESFKAKRDAIFEELTVRREVLPEEVLNEDLLNLDEDYIEENNEEDIAEEDYQDDGRFELKLMSAAYYRENGMEEYNPISIPVGDAYAVLINKKESGDYTYITESMIDENRYTTEVILSDIKLDVDNSNCEIFELREFLGMQSVDSLSNVQIYGVYSDAGSLSLLSNKVMDDLSEEMGGIDDFYIIPSSTKEFLAVSSNYFSNRMFIENMFETIRAVNSTLSDGEILSYNLLKYDFETRTISSVTEEELLRALPLSYENVEEGTPAFSNVGVFPPEEDEIDEEIENEELENYLEDNGVVNEFYESQTVQGDSQDMYEEFEDYDTNYEHEFAAKMLELFKWKAPDETFSLIQRLGVTYLVGAHDVHIDMTEANRTYQTNNQSFLEIGLDLFNDYTDRLTRVLTAEEESLPKEEAETDSFEQNEEEFEEGYFPFE